MDRKTETGSERAGRVGIPGPWGMVAVVVCEPEGLQRACMKPGFISQAPALPASGSVL